MVAEVTVPILMAPTEVLTAEVLYLVQMAILIRLEIPIAIWQTELQVDLTEISTAIPTEDILVLRIKHLAVEMQTAHKVVLQEDKELLESALGPVALETNQVLLLQEKVPLELQPTMQM